MKKIKLKQLVEKLYKEELKSFEDPRNWASFTKEEIDNAIAAFKEEWSDIESIDDLLGTLCECGYDDDAAVDLVLCAAIEE